MTEVERAGAPTGHEEVGPQPRAEPVIRADGACPSAVTAYRAALSALSGGVG